MFRILFYRDNGENQEKFSVPILKIYQRKNIYFFTGKYKRKHEKYKLKISEPEN